MAQLGRLALCVVALLLVVAAGVYGDNVGGQAPAPGGAAGPLRMGLLLNFSAGAPERSLERQRAFDLAVQHVNAAGGVLGRPVQVAVADSTLSPEVAVAAARRLVDEEDIHVLVGPSTSGNTLPVAERVIGPAGIPTVSPSSSSPMLTAAEDRDFLFRAVLSDSVQGPALAEVARSRGFTNLGLIYVNDAWGVGLSTSFLEAWDGEIRAVAIEPGQTDFLAQLQDTASGGAEALVMMTFEKEAVFILQTALDEGIYARFLFGDALKSPGLARAVGGGRLDGMYGTGAGAAQDNPANVAWERAYREKYGGLPEFAYVKETYDAAIALALATQAAGGLDGAAIRDNLRSVGGGPGEKVIAGPEGIAAALAILRDGGTVDYDGAAVTLDWDENGDLSRGYVGVWRFTAEEKIEEVEVMPVETSPPP